MSFRERRLRLGLRQADIADAAEVTQQTVSNVEAGRTAYWRTLRRIDRALTALEDR